MVLFDRLRTTGFINDDPMSYAEMLELMDGPVVCKLSTSSGFIGSLNFHIKHFRENKEHLNTIGKRVPQDNHLKHTLCKLSYKTDKTNSFNKVILE